MIKAVCSNILLYILNQLYGFLWDWMIKQNSKANVIVFNSISMTRELPQNFYQEKVFYEK